MSAGKNFQLEFPKTTLRNYHLITWLHTTKTLLLGIILSGGNGHAGDQNRLVDEKPKNNGETMNMTKPLTRKR